jgi:hypothetical protein
MTISSGEIDDEGVWGDELGRWWIRTLRFMIDPVL